MFYAIDVFESKSSQTVKLSLLEDDKDIKPHILTTGEQEHTSNLFTELEDNSEILK